jgi:hypothetical protein
VSIKPRNSKELTVSELVGHLAPGEWFQAGDVPDWPPDVFAFAASLLKRSGAYVEIVNQWPPRSFSESDDWAATIGDIAKDWRARFELGKTPPVEVCTWWADVVKESNTPLSELPTRRALVESLTNLLAAADEASGGIGIVDADVELDKYYDLTLAYLEGNQSGCSSLCQMINASSAMVLPKLHTPQSGITLRSLSHNLALWDRPEVRPIWRQLRMPNVKHGFNLLVLPWPLEVDPSTFQPQSVDAEQMPGRFGFFSYIPPKASGDYVGRVTELVRRARVKVGRLDGIVFPELSLRIDDFQQLKAALPGLLIIGGVGGEGADGKFGVNSVMVGLDIGEGKHEYTQHKHHRWRLESGQIEQYGLGCGLDGRMKWWWESLTIQRRDCTFFSVNPWLTFCVLICEDLARQDPVAELVRTVGPNLVIGLLMDGPQLGTRWSARYATVLADDPRCSVLTVTSAGLVDLTRSQGLTGSRSIALWKDALSREAKEIILDQQSEGILLSLSCEFAEEWSADGRSDTGQTGYLRLSGIHQLHRM